MQIYMIMQMCHETQRPKDPHKKKGMCLGRDVVRIYYVYIYIYIINSYYIDISINVLYFVKGPVKHSVQPVYGPIQTPSRQQLSFYPRNNQYHKEVLGSCVI